MRFFWIPLALALAGCGEKDSAGTDRNNDDSAGGDSAPSEGTDADGDGYKASEDCDDNNDAVNPGAQEVCDGQDNNCDGNVDDDDPNVSGQSKWYADSDGDGFGEDGASAQLACEAPSKTAEETGDCDDGDKNINPDASETCDGVDNDCDDLTDDADPTLGDGTWYYPDLDADGYGDADSGQYLCTQPSGYVADGTDCDDDDRQVRPGGKERCSDEIDNDCDGLVDSDDETCGGTSTGGWSGAESFRLGFDRKPDTFLCEMYWKASGTKSSNPCPECDYSFDVTLTYDTTKSTYSYDGCADLEGDQKKVYGIDIDFYGYGFGVLWQYGEFYDSSTKSYVTEWAPVMYADWDAGTSRVDYQGLYYYENYPYTYKGKQYYYTNAFAGYATAK